MARRYDVMVKPIKCSIDFINSLSADNRLGKIYLTQQKIGERALFNVRVGNDRPFKAKIIPIVVEQVEEGLIDPISGVLFDSALVNSLLLDYDCFGIDYFENISAKELKSNIEKMNECELDIYRLYVQRLALSIAGLVKEKQDEKDISKDVDDEESSLEFIRKYQKSHGINITK